jgi:hypothetical protein
MTIGGLAQQQKCRRHVERNLDDDRRNGRQEFEMEYQPVGEARHGDDEQRGDEQQGTQPVDQSLPPREHASQPVTKSKTEQGHADDRTPHVQRAAVERRQHACASELGKHDRRAFAEGQVQQQKRR